MNTEKNPRTNRQEVRGDSDLLRSRCHSDLSTRRAEAATRCMPLSDGRRDPSSLVTDGVDTPDGWTMPPRRRPRVLTLTTLRDDWTDSHRTAEQRQTITTHAKALQRVQTERAAA